MDSNMLIAVIGGYLLGSIPFGLLLTRIAGLGDIREIGSGNIGATNVLRTGRKDLALLTLLLDSGKGAIAVILASIVLDGQLGAAAGAAAFIGHCYPIYLKFKGGKGVATFVGTILAIDWTVGMTFGAAWLLSTLVFRMSSLSGLLGSLIATAYAYQYGGNNIWVTVCAMTVVIFIRHKDNIIRIAQGSEPKIGKK
jgi:acyl phosphate:glycerol-3-phosphate acyltransferase